MSAFSHFFLAEYHLPLFGNQWLALIAILGGIALLMIAVAAVGRWLAATHPNPIANVREGEVASSGTISPEITAIIAASIAVVLGPQARIASVKLAPLNVEMLMQQWSLEGRRQIYSSHQIR